MAYYSFLMWFIKRQFAALKLVKCDLSIGSTETKYIKPNTKTENNIVISWIFHKKWYCYFGFFWKNLTQIQVFTKKSAGLVYGFLVFCLSTG